MSAASPITENTDLVELIVLVNGTEIESTYQVFLARVTKEVNRISTAVLEIIDGDPTTEDFVASDSAIFVPGSPITIKAGYHATSSVIFSGIIVKHSLRAHPPQAARLVVECKDNAVKMTVGRQNAVYQNQVDSAVMSSLISKYGLTPKVTSTSYTNKELVQYYATDWDFLLTRADAYGMIVTNDQGTLTVAPPNTATTPVLELAYGNTLLEFEMDMDARDQYSAVKASSWDMSTQAMLSASGSNPGVTTPGNITSSTLAGVIGLASFDLQTNAAMEQSDIQNWANGCWMKSQYAMIRGRLRFQGNAVVLPGNLVQVAGVGNRFNGTVLVSKVVHEIENGEWITNASLGLDADWLAETRSRIEAAPASAVLPGISGLQTGIVKQIISDPDNQFRVMVTIPVFNNLTAWARLTNPYATASAGTYFYPEVGDEVVLGFFNNDPRFPVIMGSLYSSSKTPPYTPDDPNTYKAIVSKNLVKIEIDDANKVLTIVTPNKNSIVLSDQAQSITITDQNSNKIEMSSSGILIESASNITLKAPQNIEATASVNVSVTASNALSLSGMTVSGSAQTELKMEGTASAQFTSSAQTVVKGAIVMIN